MEEIPLYDQLINIRDKLQEELLKLSAGLINLDKQLTNIALRIKPCEKQ